MNKEELIRKYGIEDYEKELHQEEERNNEDPEKRTAWSREQSHKGGKWYEYRRKYQRIGLQGERNRIRAIHGNRYRPFKKIIAPDSQQHHQWIPGTANYTGVALVEKDKHQHGYIDVIRILEGEITLLTEAEIRGI